MYSMKHSLDMWTLVALLRSHTIYTTFCAVTSIKISSRKDLSLNEEIKILDSIKEQPVNTPLCELKKCLKRV